MLDKDLPLSADSWLLVSLIVDFLLIADS